MYHLVALDTEIPIHVKHYKNYRRGLPDDEKTQEHGHQIKRHKKNGAHQQNRKSPEIATCTLYKEITYKTYGR